MEPFIRRLVKGSAAALLVKVAGAFLSYVMFVGLARAMTIEQFGWFSFAFSVGVILAKIAVGGQQKVVLRDVSRRLGAELDGKDSTERDFITFRSYLTVFILSFTSGLLLFIFMAAFRIQSPGSSALYMLAIFIPAMAFSELQTSLLRSYNKVLLAMTPREVIWRGGVCASGFMIALLSNYAISAAAAMFYCATLLALVTFFQIFLSPPIKMSVRGFNWRTSFDRDWLALSAHFWITTVVTFGAPMLSVVFIGIFLSPVESGPFFAALKSSQTISLILMSLAIIASPLISKAFSDRDDRKLQLICRYCSAVGSFFAVIAFITFLSFGRDVLDIFGDGYSESYPELLILSAGYVVNAACGANATLLEMTRYQKNFMRLILLTNAFGIVALLPFTVWGGTIGAAVVVSGTLIAWNIFASVLALKYTGIDPTILGLFRRRRSDDRL